jgi:DNA polymerase
MSEPADKTPPDPARHLRAHVESLRAAGVEWLPAGGPPPAPPAAAPAEGVSQPGTLFDERIGAPPEEVAPPEERKRELTVLAERVAGCTRCAELARKRKQTVFGVGKVDPEICFVGEAPGYNEDAQGEPFVGEAGQLLNRIIAACGMKRADVYICNIIKCRPPDNRLPLPDEAGNCREYLERQLELVRPKFLCALGACAAQNLLDTKMPIGKLRGKFHDYRGIPVLCTYHPAYLLRSPEKKKDVWEDMKKLLARMGRPVPGK